VSLFLVNKHYLKIIYLLGVFKIRFLINRTINLIVVNIDFFFKIFCNCNALDNMLNLLKDLLSAHRDVKHVARHSHLLMLLIIVFPTNDHCW